MDPQAELQGCASNGNSMSGLVCKQLDSQVAKMFQGLEFLDWGSLEARERYALQTILYGPPPEEQEVVGEEQEMLHHEEQQEWIEEEQPQEVWEQQQPDYGEMQQQQQLSPSVLGRGPPMPLYQQMLGHPPPPTPPVSQPNVNAIYPLIMPGQPGMIVGNVNLSVNANVQSYVAPMSSYQQQQYDPDKRRNKGKGKYKPEEQHAYHHAAPYVTYHSGPYGGFVPHHPHHPTPQQVSGTPLFISTPPQYPQPIFYPGHIQYMVPMQQVAPQQQQEPEMMEPLDMGGPVAEVPVEPAEVVMEAGHHHLEEQEEEPTASVAEDHVYDLEDVKVALPELPQPAAVMLPPPLPPPALPDPPLVPEEVVEVVVDSAPEPVKTPEPAAPPPRKSWASIVQSSAAPAQSESSVSPKPLARVVPYTPSEKSPPTQAPPTKVIPPVFRTAEQEAMLEDPALYRLAEHLCKHTLDHRSSALQPRGLTNRSNWCYVNATLQALLACPPFFNLMRNLPVKQPNPKARFPAKSLTPIIDAVVDFVQQFSTLPPGSRPARKEKAAARRAAPGDESCVVDVPQGVAFEPSCVYAMLGSIRSCSFSAVEGRQEDAEEFLSCLLNALNDEMLELMKLLDHEEEQPVTNGHHSDEDPEEWTVMRGKNRACLTRRSDFGRTPVSDIFRGQLCSHVTRKGDQQSETVQPFYTLQLDIEKAKSVKEALEQMVDRDWLEGVTCSKTQQQVEAWQQVTLEELPPVLLLHLKWFDYKADGCSKIMKSMEYAVDLRIDNKLLSNSKNKYTPKQRIYKLFAVVYHDGKEASKGHYITDAYHSAMGVWVRYDDSQVRVVTEHAVTHPRQPAVPYILYYRRSDTMGGPSLNH